MKNIIELLDHISKMQTESRQLRSRLGTKTTTETQAEIAKEEARIKEDRDKLGTEMFDKFDQDISDMVKIDGFSVGILSIEHDSWLHTRDGAWNTSPFKHIALKLEYVVKERKFTEILRLDLDDMYDVEKFVDYLYESITTQYHKRIVEIERKYLKLLTVSKASCGIDLFNHDGDALACHLFNRDKKYTVVLYDGDSVMFYDTLTVNVSEAGITMSIQTNSVWYTLKSNDENDRVRVVFYLN